MYEYVGDDPNTYVDPLGLFDSRYHRQQTTTGLANSGLSAACIKIIADADVNQDNGALTDTGPFHNPANHGDNGVPGIQDTINLIMTRWKGILATKKCCSCDDAYSILKEFGKILHAVQDLYAHSNYVETIDYGSSGLATVGLLPLWPMFNPDGTPNIPPGVTTGNYRYHYPWQKDPSPPPTHDQMNHDNPDTPAGRILNQAGTSMFDLANDLATRHTTDLWNALSTQMAGNPCWAKVLSCCQKKGKK